MMRASWLAGVATVALGWGGCLGEAVAESASQEVKVAEAKTDKTRRAVDEITVTATRRPATILDVPATVSVITDIEIEDNLATDIKDLVRFEPGVSVRSGPARFTAASASTGRDGNSGFNIRGLEGNRVLIQVDGIRMPDAFGFGPAILFGRGDYLDLDLVKSVEILRGPASSLYGSDGLAGAVSFLTKDPDDILEPGTRLGGRARIAYASADESVTEGLVGAADLGRWSALLAYTRRDGHEQDNQGENEASNVTRTEPNPQDTESNAVLAKLLFTPSEAHRFRLTYEYSDLTSGYDVLSAIAVPPLGASSTIGLAATDETDRTRVSFDHSYSGDGVIDHASWAVYYQESSTRQFSAEDRNISADRERDNTFDNEVYGASAELQSDFTLFGLDQSFVYGGDVSKTRQSGLRDGTVPPIGESFPTRSFPTTDYVLAGLFIQDEITFLDGRLKVYPALRYDYYDLDPEPDALYTAAAPGQSDSKVTPKLGAVFWATDRFGLFANYAQGFKAPSPSQVNNAFVNPVFFYRSEPNPDLKPETSETFEGGVRFRDIEIAGGNWLATASAFYGQYEDFIDQVQISGNFTPLNPGVFKFVNVGKVEISGAEARLEGKWSSGFGVMATASYAQGDKEADGVGSPLESIDPIKVVGGLLYRHPSGRFGGQLVLTHSQGQDDAWAGGTVCASNCFTPDAFTILDATAYVDLLDFVTLRAGIFNITDEKYWWWSDVRGQSASSMVLDAFTQPGRNFSISLSVRF